MEHTPNEIDLWSIYLPDCRSEVESCRALLSGKELERAAKFFKPKDAENFILSRGLLRRILGERLSMEPSAIVFERNGNGKPFLSGTEVEFNVSHSRDRLLIAVASGRALGIDIEFRRSGINMNEIAKRWFAPEERAFFHSTSGRGASRLRSNDRRAWPTLEKPEEAFFDIWAKKEAYVKALGIGIFKELSSFAVPLGEAPNVPTLGKNGEWFFQTLEIDRAYAAALVSEAPATPVCLRTI